MRVLLIEDDAAYRRALQLQLEAKGCDVSAFGSGLDALAAVEHGMAADFLVTDIHLTKGEPHGVSVALMLRMKRPGMPVAFITGHTDYLDTPLTSDLGPVFLKPVNAALICELAEGASRA